MAVAILSAMITPAVLISACGTLTMSTANRLGRIIDRTRRISERFEALARGEGDQRHLERERTLLLGQLERATRRSRLLQRALATLYAALTVFVTTSAAIGIVAIIGNHLAWLPVAFGLFGAGLLLYASLLLIVESRIALASLEAEVDFVRHLGHHHVPTETASAAPVRGIFGRFRRRNLHP